MVYACLLLALSSLPAMADTPTTSELVVVMQGLKVQEGTLKLTLFDEADAYPKRPEDALRSLDVPVRGATAQARFVGLPYGTYAVSVHHDENDNGKLDTTIIGVPNEGLGASNDAKGFMGPPKFDAAAFDVDSPQVSITVQMEY